MVTSLEFENIVKDLSAFDRTKEIVTEFLVLQEGSYKMDPATAMGLGSAAIAALSAVFAAAITGYWGYRSVRATSEESKLKEGNLNLKKELVVAYRQIAAFHRTEDQMAIHIAENKRVAVKTIKTQFRDMACAHDEERPKFTAKSAMQRAIEIEAS